MSSSTNSLPPNTPILIGGGQVQQRDADPASALDPVALMAEAAGLAAADAGSDARLLAGLDKIAVVNIIGWHYSNAPRLLAERVGAKPAQEIYTTVGGNTPQWLVNHTADEIAAGKTRFALIAGAEAIESVANARKQGVHLDWPKDGEGKATVIGDQRHGSSDSEMMHGLVLPSAVYPLFENALRAHYGWSIEEHRRRLGILCSRMTKVAAANPNAWFQIERSPEEITTAAPDNRMVAFPYTKYMNAIMNVDQSAAVLMTSVQAAREMGIPESRWIFLHGGAEATDLWFPTERANFHSSPAIARAGREALAQAGRSIDEIDLFDIYSCFPIAVEIGRDMLGIAHDDPRDLTVTGGLPYHGGPGNNYVTHSIAQMIRRLRDGDGKLGLVTGLGWYITKHSVGIYGTEPAPWAAGGWSRPDPKTYQAEIDRMPHPEVRTSASGPATIETYTVLFDRDGTPTRGIVVARLPDGARVISNTQNDREVLEGLLAGEAIGRPGKVETSAAGNVFAPS